MTTPTYSIAFNFQLHNSQLIVPLTAEVEVDQSEIYYVINFKSGADRRESVLPNLVIKKKRGSWVHIDSERESCLSIQVGKAIESLENELAHAANNRLAG